jgi:hypothetical protein
MIKGFVESLPVDAQGETRVVGWVCDTEDHSHNLEVRVRIGDRIIGHGIADRDRPELRTHGLSDGHSGFVVSLGGWLSDADQNQLKIEAKRQDAEDWVELPEWKPAGNRLADRRNTGEVLANPWSDSAVRTDLAQDRPVFVLGSARSGTSAIYQSLVLATRYRGFFEGHVLDMAGAVSKAVEEHYRIKAKEVRNPIFFHLAKINGDATFAAMEAMLRQLTGGYETPYWADKTPTPRMVLSVPVLASTWPLARFIFMKRRGIENVMSRQRRFRSVSFEYNAGDWAASMAAWRAVRGKIPGKFLEFEQVELLSNPDSCATATGQLLELDQAEINALAERLRRHRPETTDPTGRIVSRIEDTGWTPDQIAAFRSICHEEMVAYGYTYDERYTETAFPKSS